MKTYHLTHGTTLWELKEEKTTAVLVSALTKAYAITESASYVRKNGGGSVRIHNEDGTFDEERTYEPAIDPPQSKG